LLRIPSYALGIATRGIPVTTTAPPRIAPDLPEGRTMADFEGELRALKRTGSVLSDAFKEASGLTSGPCENGKPKRGAPTRLTPADLAAADFAYMDFREREASTPRSRCGAPVSERAYRHVCDTVPAFRFVSWRRVEQLLSGLNRAHRFFR